MGGSLTCSLTAPNRWLRWWLSSQSRKRSPQWSLGSLAAHVRHTNSSPLRLYRDMFVRCSIQCIRHLHEYAYIVQIHAQRESSLIAVKCSLRSTCYASSSALICTAFFLEPRDSLIVDLVGS